MQNPWRFERHLPNNSTECCSTRSGSASKTKGCVESNSQEYPNSPPNIQYYFEKLIQKPKGKITGIFIFIRNIVPEYICQ